MCIYPLQVIIMSTQCDVCGYKNSDVRSGSAISEKGKMVTLKVQELADLQRDVIKAETAAVLVPELDFEITSGSLGSLITTVEGVLQRVKRELHKYVLEFSSLPEGFTLVPFCLAMVKLWRIHCYFTPRTAVTTT